MRIRWKSVLAVGSLLALAVQGTASAAPGVDPATVHQTLHPGESTTITKTVSTPAIAPKPDIYFLADTTGSMDPAISNVKANAGSILSAVDAVANDPRYGAGDYKDFPHDPYAFQNDASIPAADDDGAAAVAGINTWAAGGGFDGSEASLFALHKLLQTAGFRADATKIVVWFGDAPGHDPVCSAISGEASDVTEASVTAELVAAGVKVIAVSTPTGFYAQGLNDDPAFDAGDYGSCTPGGLAGQAGRIAGATGGTYSDDVPASEVSDTIISGLTNLPITVTPVATCDPGLSASFSPSTLTVTSGDPASFQETLTLASNVTPGDKTCTVDFQLNGQPGGPAFVETNTISHNTPPDCGKVTATPASLWPPNHKFQTVSLAGVTDADGDATTLTITGVTQDEALNGLGDGDTAPDAAKVAGHVDQVKVRAERGGKGDGRVYRIAFSASDGTDTCAGTAFVGVPHDQSGPAAVDTVAVVVNSFGP